MKIKAAFVLLALVAFVALLQSADAFRGGSAGTRKGCMMRCRRTRLLEEECSRRCGFSNGRGDDDDDVLDLLERRPESYSYNTLEFDEVEDDDEDYVEDARELFGQRTAIWTVLDSNRRLRKHVHRHCRQENIQNCNHAGVCTMDTIQCCGKKCNPPPPGGPPPPPPPAMDLMEDYESVGTSPEERMKQVLNGRGPGWDEEDARNDVFYDPTMDFSNRRLRKRVHVKCKQVNIQHCNHAGVCTMNTHQCCGKKCGAPPPAP